MAASSSKPSRVASRVAFLSAVVGLLTEIIFNPTQKKASHSDAGINFKNAVCEKHH